MTKGIVTKGLSALLASVSVSDEAALAGVEGNGPGAKLTVMEKLNVYSRMKTDCRTSWNPLSCVTALSNREGEVPPPVVYDYALLKCSFEANPKSCFYLANKAANEKDFKSAVNQPNS